MNYDTVDHILWPYDKEDLDWDECDEADLMYADRALERHKDD